MDRNLELEPWMKVSGHASTKWRLLGDWIRAAKRRHVSLAGIGGRSLSESSRRYWDDIWRVEKFKDEHPGEPICDAPRSRILTNTSDKNVHIVIPPGYFKSGTAASIQLTCEEAPRGSQESRKRRDRESNGALPKRARMGGFPIESTGLYRVFGRSSIPRSSF